MILIDIETKPKPELVERYIKPFEALDPSAIKYGNTKDPVLRANKLKEEQEKHGAAEIAHWSNAKDRAALNPLTGEILCIGMLHSGGVIEIIGDDDCGEKVILQRFWDIFLDPNFISEPFVFWSGNGSSTDNFDPDYIIRRSWILGVKVPPSAFNEGYLGRRFQDATRRYLLGKRDGFCGLTRAADELGLYSQGADIAPKTDTDLVKGENFWQWWEGRIEGQAKEAQRDFAEKYLRNDLRTLAAINDRIT